MFTPKYKDALKTNKVKVADLLPAAKRAYDEMQALEPGLKELHTLLGETESEDDKKAIDKDIKAAEKTCDKLDKRLCMLIKNNTQYKANSANLAKGRVTKKAIKKEGGGEAAATEEEPIIEEEVQQPEVEIVENPVVEVPTEVVVEQTTPTEVIEGTEIKKADKKKSNNTGYWIAGILGAIGLGGFAAYKFKIGPFKK